MNGDSLESAVPTPQIPRVKDPILEGTEDIPHRERQTPPHDITSSVAHAQGSRPGSSIPCYLVLLPAAGL